MTQLHFHKFTILMNQYTVVIWTTQKLVYLIDEMVFSSDFTTPITDSCIRRKFANFRSNFKLLPHSGNEKKYDLAN